MEVTERFGAGSIQSNGNLGSLTVGGDIKGGKGDHTGKVSVFGNSGKIHVLGSVLGGAGGSAGNVSVEKSRASLTIDGELVGGTTAASYKSGYIHVGGALGPVAVNGNMKGGLGEFSGVIDVDGAANDTVFLGLTGDFMLHEI